MCFGEIKCYEINKQRQLDLTPQITEDTGDSVIRSEYWGRVPLSHSDRRPCDCTVHSVEAVYLATAYADLMQLRPRTRIRRPSHDSTCSRSSLISLSIFP